MFTDVTAANLMAASAIDAWLFVGVLAASGTVAVLVYLAREQYISRTGVHALTITCALALVAMLVTDWPTEILADFWADHSVLAGLLSTVLLVGVVFLVFEDAERRAQERLDNSLTAAGLGGIVDHVIDVEMALALVARPDAPDRVGFPAWSEPGKPLSWVRERREALGAPTEHRDATVDDPRLQPAWLGDCELGESLWRLTIIDECVRRLLGAIRDWSPVVNNSRNGMMVLIALSQIRNDLMSLAHSIQNGETTKAAENLAKQRSRLRLLAYFMERQSGAVPMRHEVLRDYSHLLNVDGAYEWMSHLAGRGHGAFSPEWREELKESHDELVRTTDSRTNVERAGGRGVGAQARR